MSLRKLLTISLLAAGVTALLQPARADDSAQAARRLALKGTLATYCQAPRQSNGRVDTQLLLTQLLDLHANTYSFCIHGNSNDWADLQLFLPLARAHGIRVWGSVVPPSESPPRTHAYAEPFRTNYVQWAEAFAKLALRETNLVAWSIDDFPYNVKTTFTPDYVHKMIEDARAISPRLAFVPCCYFKQITTNFVAKYGVSLDGILFPYRHDSAGGNLKDATLVEPEVKKIKALTGPDLPIIVDVYATAHSRLGASTPEYVRAVMMGGKASADGVMIYCHQDPNRYPEKYQIIKELFGAWTRQN